MQFVWALFFIGTGNVQPVDTGYRFESRVQCTSFLISASERAVDPFFNLIDENGEATRQWREMSEKGQIDLQRRMAEITDQYFCMLHK